MLKFIFVEIIFYLHGLILKIRIGGCAILKPRINILDNFLHKSFELLN
jgi:hypothetical protein